MPNHIETIVVDDNLEHLNFLSGLVEQHKNLDLIGIAKNKIEAVQLIDLKKPQLLLLDIELGDGNAFELLDGLNDDLFDVIFVSGFDQYIKQALEYYAFYFLSKPFGERKFNEVINRYLQKTNSQFNLSRFKYLEDYLSRKNDSFLVHTGNDYITINLDDVLYCKSSGNYTEFHSINGKKILASQALKFYDAIFKYRGFFRASRFHLVNCKNIKCIRKKEAIHLVDGQIVSVSVRNRENLSKLIENFNKKSSIFPYC